MWQWVTTEPAMTGNKWQVALLKAKRVKPFSGFCCRVTQDKYMSSEDKDISTFKLSQLLCDLAPHTLHLDSYLIKMEWIIRQWNDLEILISCALLS